MRRTSLRCALEFVIALLAGFELGARSARTSAGRRHGDQDQAVVARPAALPRMYSVCSQVKGAGRRTG